MRNPLCNHGRHQRSPAPVDKRSVNSRSPVGVETSPDQPSRLAPTPGVSVIKQLQLWWVQSARVHLAV
jgi:hypothetical protein